MASHQAQSNRNIHLPNIVTKGGEPKKGRIAKKNVAKRMEEGVGSNTQGIEVTYSERKMVRMFSCSQGPGTGCTG